MLVKGHTMRVYYFPTIKLGIVLDHESRYGCYSPTIALSYRGGNGTIHGKGITMPVPHMSWKFGYKFRKFGGLFVYGIIMKFIYKTFSNPT